MDPQTWWFVARAGGLVAYALLGIAVIVGLLITTRQLGQRPAPDWMLDWHRFVAGLSVVFTLVHLVGIWADDYIEFALVDLMVPFVADWRPVAVGLGVISFYFVLAVEMTSLLRRWMPRRSWRLVHRLSVPAFAVATVHLWMAGADASNPVVLVATGALSGTVAVLLAIWASSAIGGARRSRHIVRHPVADAADPSELSARKGTDPVQAANGRDGSS